MTEREVVVTDGAVYRIETDPDDEIVGSSFIFLETAGTFAKDVRYLEAGHDLMMALVKLHEQWDLFGWNLNEEEISGAVRNAVVAALAELRDSLQL